MVWQRVKDFEGVAYGCPSSVKKSCCRMLPLRPGQLSPILIPPRLWVSAMLRWQRVFLWESVQRCAKLFRLKVGVAQVVATYLQIALILNDFGISGRQM